MKGTAWKAIRGTRDYALEKPLQQTRSKTHDTPEQIAVCLNCSEPECRGGQCARLTQKAKLKECTKKRVFGREIAVYEYRGKTYTSNQIARMVGLSGDTVRKRFEKGWTVEQVISGVRRREPAQPKRRGAKYAYKGGEYTAAELSELIGISASLIRGRRHQGWSDERIASTPVRTYDERM